MKNHVLPILIAFSVLISFAGCRRQAVLDEPLIVGAYKGGDAGLVYVADGRSSFSKAGLTVRVSDYQAGKLAIKDLLDGKVDIATCSETAFMFRSFSHPELRIIASIAEPNVQRFVARRDHGIEEPSQLAGKKIGVKRGTGAEFFTSTFLMHHGVSVDSVKLIDTKSKEAVHALLKGDIDACMLWVPEVPRLEEELGDDLLVWPGQMSHMHYFLAVTTAERAASKPEHIKRFVHCLVDTQRSVKEQQDKAVGMLAGALGQEEAFLRQHWEEYGYNVSLPQALLLLLEDQARWAIAGGLTEAESVPNYLDFLAADALEQVAPEAVTIIH